MIEMDANAAEAIPEKRCYTIEELMIMMDVSRNTVTKLLKAHEFSWFKIGSTYRISRKSFDEWLDRHI